MKLSSAVRNSYLKKLAEIAEYIEGTNITEDLYRSMKSNVERQHQANLNKQASTISSAFEKGFFAGLGSLIQPEHSEIRVPYPKHQEPAARFYLSLLTMKYKDEIDSKDVLLVKRQAEVFKEYVLDLPEVNSINEYGFLVNALANFINFCASCFTKSPLIESRMRRETTAYFDEWERSIGLTVKKELQAGEGESPTP